MLSMQPKYTSIDVSTPQIYKAKKEKKKIHLILYNTAKKSIQQRRRFRHFLCAFFSDFFFLIPDVSDYFLTLERHFTLRPTVKMYRQNGFCGCQ